VADAAEQLAACEPGRVHERLRVLVGSLADGALPVISDEPPAGTVLIDLGPDHPSHAGLIELRLWVHSGAITSAQVVVGAMHRGVEKLFEVRDYTQILMLADRHDWHAPFFGELAVALTAEQQMGLTVPDRARWLRTLLAEHTRILSHIGMLTWVARRGSADSGLTPLREALRRQTADLTGNRIHPMVNRIGGLAADADAGWLRTEARVMTEVRTTARLLLGLVGSVPVAELTRGVATLDAATIAQYGVSGPVARASGVHLDLRHQQSYLAYPELADLIDPPGSIVGDAQARLTLLAEEMITSSRLVDACIERLDGMVGPVAVKLGKIIRLPEGEGYAAVEAPLGIAGVYLSSRGEKTPWRLKLRTPSFNNIASLESMLVGIGIDTLEATLASVGYVVGDIDK
jgi:NADH-quinone oxidoreductase subunit D